ISPSACDPGRSSDIVLDEGTLCARVGALSVALTGQECRLLRVLLETPGELVSRERLCREGLGRVSRPFDRSLDMQISRIRKKIGLCVDGSERIRSIRGEGYMVVLPGRVH
ncbi:MAG: winged helix-turn-helix domain-containing protein, partial [Bilophila sp.]